MRDVSCKSYFIVSRLNTKAINLHVLRRVYIVTQLVFDEKNFSLKLYNENFYGSHGFISNRF